MHHVPDERNPRVAAAISRYWKRNTMIMAILLTVWAVVGLGAGVLFADALNAYRIGGYPLGFWFAQQGSIIVFVLLILIYAVLMNRLDRQHHADLEAADADKSPAGSATSDAGGSSSSNVRGGPSA